MKFIISRTDNLGDVILTLPLAGFLKTHFPQCHVFFIGKTYTKALIEACSFVDVFLDRNELLQNPKMLQELHPDYIFFVFPDKELAKLAKNSHIPQRIGTSHRWFHWLYANKLVNFSRKKSDLHEAQLNFKLLDPLVRFEPTFEQLIPFFGLKASEKDLESTKNYFTNKFSVILHPKSKGSAREWSLDNFYELAKKLDSKKYQIFITGVAAEGEAIRVEKPELFDLEQVTDLTGKFSLAQLLAFVSQADALVAASTGTLHIAASLGKLAIGIYPPIRPMHPQRWRPIGKKAHVLVAQKDCQDCRKTQNCACMRSISPETVFDLLEKEAILLSKNVF